MDDNLEDVVANIKATLNSSQNKITLEALNRDYISVVGCGIPFRRLNFSSLEDLIRATPGLSLNRIGHQTFVEVKADAKTAHIAKLVREQKAAKKKSKGRGPPRRNFGGPPRNNYNRSSSYRNFTPRPSNNSYSHKSYNSHDNRFKDVDRTYSNGSGHDNRYKDLDRPYSNGSENRTSYSNYRRPEPCAYNFSDNDDDNDLDDDFLECDTPSSDEEAKAPVPIVSATREPNLTNNFKNLHITVENKHFGGGTTNTRLRGGLKIAPRSYSHRTNTAEDDVGYGSMKKKPLGMNDYPKPYNPNHFRRDDVSIERSYNAAKSNNSTVSKVCPKFDDWDDTVIEPESHKNNSSSVNSKFDDWDDSVDIVSDRDTSAGILDDWDDSVEILEVDDSKNNRIVSNHSRSQLRSHGRSDSESSNVYDWICISSAQKYEDRFEKEFDEPETTKSVLPVDGKRRKKPGESTASRIARLLMTQQEEEPHRQMDEGESVRVTVSNHGFSGGRVVHLL